MENDVTDLNNKLKLKSEKLIYSELQMNMWMGIRERGFESTSYMCQIWREGQRINFCGIMDWKIDLYFCVTKYTIITTHTPSQILQ